MIPSAHPVPQMARLARPAVRRALTVVTAGLIVAAAPGSDGGVQGSPVGQQPAVLPTVSR
jgi:hypothetical protein